VCTVLIADPHLLSTLTERMSAGDGELLTFSDADALRALEVITQRRAHVVVVERLFAATSRGAALISRIRADPSLRNSKIRIVSRDGDDVNTRLQPPSTGDVGNDAASAPLDAAIDHVGTRRVTRQRVDEFVGVLVDGHLASVVDLSTNGAQVVSATVLKPSQRVHVSLSDEQGVLRFNAAVAWASFEIPRNGGPRYRAGIAFLDANSAEVYAYASRHKTA
jgi:hypothetical protein